MITLMSQLNLMMYNLPKNEDSRQPQCPEDKESAIVETLKHFKMNS